MQLFGIFIFILINYTISLKQNSPTNQFVDNFQKDIQSDINLNSEVFKYFNKKPSLETKLDDLKNKIKETGYKEFEDIINNLDNYQTDIYSKIENPYKKFNFRFFQKQFRPKIQNGPIQDLLKQY